MVGGLSLLVGVINGLLGGGGGMLCVPLLVYAFGMEEKKAHASAILVMLITSVCSSVFYITNKNIEVDWKLFGIVCGLLILGAVIGSMLLKKLKGKVVSIIFAVVMLAAGIGMVVR